MKTRVIIHAWRPWEYFIEGVPATKEQFDAVNLCKQHGPVGAPRLAGNSLGAWPMMSDAMAVHPEQIPEVMERNKKAGLHIEYNPVDGRPILPDRGARRRLMELEGVHDNQGGYGDDHKPNVRPKPKKKLAESFIDEGVKMNVEEFTKATRKKFTGK